MQLHDIPYRVFHRDVKYPRLEFNTGRLHVILPIGSKPHTLLDKHRRWILGKVKFIEDCLKDASNRHIIESSEEEFRDLVHSLANRASKELGKKLNRIYFRTMKTKWASCSPKRNLMVNLLMRQLPEKLLNYVIFHEIAHLKEKRHNDRFWEIIEKRFNEYQEVERELFVYWFQIANKKGRF